MVKCIQRDQSRNSSNNINFPTEHSDSDYEERDNRANSANDRSPRLRRREEAALSRILSKKNLKRFERVAYAISTLATAVYRIGKFFFRN